MSKFLLQMAVVVMIFICFILFFMFAVPMPEKGNCIAMPAQTLDVMKCLNIVFAIVIGFLSIKGLPIFRRIQDGDVSSGNVIYLILAFILTAFIIAINIFNSRSLSLVDISNCSNIIYP